MAGGARIWPAFCDTLRFAPCEPLSHVQNSPHLKAQRRHGVMSLPRRSARSVSARSAPLPPKRSRRGNRNATISPKDDLKITKLETILVKPRWLFLKIHTNAGIMGLGEPITEGRALTCAEAVKEVEPYLVGKDPRPVAKHWQAILVMLSIAAVLSLLVR